MKKILSLGVAAAVVSLTAVAASAAHFPCAFLCLHQKRSGCSRVSPRGNAPLHRIDV